MSNQVLVEQSEGPGGPDRRYPAKGLIYPFGVIRPAKGTRAVQPSDGGQHLREDRAVHAHSPAGQGERFDAFPIHGRAQAGQGKVTQTGQALNEGGELVVQGIANQMPAGQLSGAVHLGDLGADGRLVGNQGGVGDSEGGVQGFSLQAEALRQPGPQGRVAPGIEPIGLALGQLTVIGEGLRRAATVRAAAVRAWRWVWVRSRRGFSARAVRTAPSFWLMSRSVTGAGRSLRRAISI